MCNDPCTCSENPLLDHLVGAGEKRRRYDDAERLGGWKIDHELEFGRKLYWQIAGLGAFQDLDHVVGCTAKVLQYIDSVADQAAVIDGFAPCVDRGQPRRQCRRSKCSPRVKNSGSRSAMTTSTRSFASVGKTGSRSSGVRVSTGMSVTAIAAAAVSISR